MAGISIAGADADAAPADGSASDTCATTAPGSWSPRPESSQSTARRSPRSKRRATRRSRSTLSGCAVHPRPRRLPHPPAVRRLASRRVRAEDRGRPVRADRRRGGGIRSSARSFATATDEDVLAQAGAAAGEMLAHGTTTFECKSGLRALGRCRGSLTAPRCRARRTGPADRHLDRRFWRTRCRTAMTPTAGWRRSRRRCPTCSQRDGQPRSTSTSRASRSATTTCARWVLLARRPRPRLCALTSSSSTPTARCRSPSRRARGRSITSPACRLTTSRRSRPRKRQRCCCQVPPSSATSTWSPRASSPTQVRSARSRATSTPGRLPSTRCR